MKRLFSSPRAFFQILGILTILGGLGIGELVAQVWLPHADGIYYDAGNVGINKPPSSWVDLDLSSRLRLTPYSETAKGWGTHLIFGNFKGNGRFNIADDFNNNCLTFNSSTPGGYFQFEGRTVMATHGGAAHYLPVGVHSDYTLAVRGKIVTHEVVVTTNGWADYVFRPDYNLLPLEAVSTHIDENGFLPNMPCAAEIEEKGIEVSTMTVMQQEKIEELFLHMIEMNERLKSLEAENAELKALLNK